MGKKNLNNLIPVKRTVTRNGTTFETTVYIRAGQEGKVEHRHVDVGIISSIRNEKDLKLVTDYIKTIGDSSEKEIFRNELVDFMKRSGVEWEEHEDKAINWMRCLMKVRRDMRVDHFVADGSNMKRKFTKYKRLSKEEANDAMFTIKMLAKSSSGRAKIYKMAEEDPNINWKHSDHKGINHMRIMMAIRESLEDGTGFTLLNSSYVLENKERIEFERIMENQKHIAEALKGDGVRVRYSDEEFKIKAFPELESSEITVTMKGKDKFLIRKTNKYTPDEVLAEELVSDEATVINVVKKMSKGENYEITGVIRDREISDRDRKTMTGRTSIKTSDWGVQSDDIDSKAVYERSKETGETMWIAKRYKDDIPCPMNSYPVEPKRENYDSYEKYSMAYREYSDAWDKMDATADEWVEKANKRPLLYSTKEEVMEWAETWDVDLDATVFEKLDSFQIWNDICPVVEEMLTMFPKLKTWNRYHGDPSPNKFKISFQEGRGYNSAFACANESGFYICPVSFEWKGCLRAIWRSVGTGHNVYGDGTYKTVVRHEFGHILEYNSKCKEWGGQRSMQSATGFVNTNINDKNFMADVKRFKRSRVKGKSQYSKENAQETFAEAFADYTSTFGTKKSDKSEFANGVEKIIVNAGFFDRKRDGETV